MDHVPLPRLMLKRIHESYREGTVATTLDMRAPTPFRGRRLHALFFPPLFLTLRVFELTGFESSSPRRGGGVASDSLFSPLLHRTQAQMVPTGGKRRMIGRGSFFFPFLFFRPAPVYGHQNPIFYHAFTFGAGRAMRRRVSFSFFFLFSFPFFRSGASNIDRL